MTAQSNPSQPNFARRLGLAPPFDRLLLVWLATTVCVVGAAVYARSNFPGTAEEAHFFERQDLPLFGVCAALIAALGWTPAAWLIRLRPSAAERTALWAVALALLCGVSAALGVRLVFHDYAFALDEFMANFDARIFAHGRLLAPVAPEWRPYITALQPMFVLQTPDHGFWFSNYLPVNAAVRALASLSGLEGLVNPAWSALSVLLVYAVGRQLWPARPKMALGAAALLASSAQLVVMGMTAYAMPAHLALNLVWLWCFLRGGRLGHAAAIATGFFASGLHQLIFHPLFAAPFVLQLWLDRRWRLAGFYTLAYAAIGLFWVYYWPLEMWVAGVPPQVAGAFGGHRFGAEVLALLAKVRFESLGAMAESLVRFVTWQNPLTAPLILAGAWAAFMAKGHMRALMLGVLLTVLAMLVLEPTQVHGWGYRYLHGLLGSACLIAVWTWARLTDGLSPTRRDAANGGFALACVLSMVVLTPVRAWQAWRYVSPYAAADAQIRSAPARVVIVDHEGPPGFDPGTVVRNDPFLRRGPKVMQLSYMNAGLVSQVCAQGGVRVFTGQDAARLGFDTVTLTVQPRVTQLRALMKALNCGVDVRR